MIHRLINIIYPPLCQLCDTPLLPAEDIICAHCLTMLARIGSMPGSVNPVAERLAGLVPYERAAGVFIYAPGNLLAHIIYDFKYHSMPRLARRMGRQMFEELIFTDFFTDVDALIPVPIHWTRLMRRTYNQSEMLAQGISELSCIPVIQALKARKHATQTRLHGKKRLENTSGKYYAIDDLEQLEGQKRVIIIDDVCTTGSTLLAASKALQEKYPDLRISLLTLAVTV